MKDNDLIWNHLQRLCDNNKQHNAQIPLVIFIEFFSDSSLVWLKAFFGINQSILNLFLDFV